ncbi:hypothetical protein [uncultured Amphritea sp.]|uniref:hypothetical protein n=1 Tax=uncultured Amphritea sp. TaxID=981605 RepID=UPI002615858F|nr:hypothetical protein [uncultured Amphritea sp.]
MSREYQTPPVELTPLEKTESLYDEIVEWYADAGEKEQRAAAKLLMVALDKFAIYEGHNWHSLVMEYVDILKHDPEKFQKILLSNRGELKEKPVSGPLQ